MDEAIALLDSMASSAIVRTMFSSDEVLNWILDIRNALTAVTTVVPEPTPVG